MTEKPLRADARRNRAKVLETAREAFATEGVMVSLDEIARRAGVGAGTVHRHFPTKEALFEAVLVDRLERLVAHGRAALEADDPGKGFLDFLATLTDDAAAKRDLADALTGAGLDLRNLEIAADLRQVLGELLTRAQHAGAVRPDIDVADLHALIVGALAAERHRADPTRPGRLASLIHDALAPRN